MAELDNRQFYIESNRNLLNEIKKKQKKNG